MSNLRGFLWSMGRCGLKAISDTINSCTGADATGWIDAARFIEAPNYFCLTYPKPFVLTMHQPQFLPAFQSIVAQCRQTPVVFVVRDPTANLNSCAKTFLTSFIGRRVDEIARLVDQGGYVANSINPEAIAQWLLPMVNYWGQWSAVKDSPHLIVEFQDLAAENYPDTLAEICDFFKLERTAPIAASGDANIPCDVFFAGYLRKFTILDRAIELRFSRWRDYWHEPGVVRLGELRSPALAEILGGGTRLNVLAKADQLLTEGWMQREQDGFAALMSRDEVAEAIASQVVRDYRNAMRFVDREVASFQALVRRKFDAAYGRDMKRFLDAHPSLATKWSSAKTYRTG